MHAVPVEPVADGPGRLPDETEIRIAERLKVAHQMHVSYMGVAIGSQILVKLLIVTARFPGGQALAVELRHAHQIRIKLDTLAENVLVATLLNDVMSAHDKRGELVLVGQIRVAPASGFQPHLDSRNDCLGEPFHLILASIQSLAETHQ